MIPSSEGPSTDGNEQDKAPKSKNFNIISPGVQILYGAYAQGHKIFGLTSRNKQSPATCIVAAVYNKILPAMNWDKKDLNRILELGDKLYRASVVFIPLKTWQSLKPNCVHPTFYVGQYKVTIFVGNDVITGESSPDHSKVTEIVRQVIPDLLEKHYAVILNVRDRNFAIWKNDSVYCFFSPHDGNSQGTLVRLGMGKSFVLILDTIVKLSDHLASVLCDRFSIYSLRILNISEAPANMSGIIGQIQQSERKTDKVKEEATLRRSDTGQTRDKYPPGFIKDIRETEQIFDVRTNSNFVPMKNGQGSLVHVSHETDVDMIIFNNLAALIMLYRKKSFMWTCQTIAEIIALGHDWSYLDFDIDTHIAGKLELRAYDKVYNLDFEKVIFGQVASKDENVPTIERAVETFFSKYDVGLIDGPQSLAIWREKGLFFSFDSKERDALGRKWTRMLSKELGPLRKGGGACVVYFDEPKKLAERYISNVPIKHRNDPFRIIYVEISEVVEGEDWNEWKYIRSGRWFLEGAESICKYLSADETNKKGKSLCVACYSLAYLMHEPENEWSADTLNKMLAQGIELYKATLSKAMADTQDKEVMKRQDYLEEAPLGAVDQLVKIEELSDISKIIEVEGKKILMLLENCAVAGRCTPVSIGSAGLKTGINTFFENYRSGILTFEDSVLPMWTDGQAFYLLDFLERINMGSIIIKTSCHLGKITAIRFQDLSDMIETITTNPKYLGCKEFCISRVESTFEGGMELPLRNYDRFGEGGAILMQRDFHEGHPMFAAHADKQTLSNLLVAMCLASINQSVEWSKIDLVDILRTGDQIYSNISEDFSECEVKQREITWEDVKPKIGMTEFSFTREGYIGVLVGKPESLQPQLTLAPEIREEMSPTDLSNHQNLMTSSLRRIISENDEDQYADEEISEPEPQPDTLEIILKAKNTKPSFNAAVECEFFTIAAWKQNDFYFVFDPKANNEKGYPSLRRIQKGIQKLQERLEKEEQERLTQMAQEEEEEDFDEETNDPYYSLDEVKSKSKIAAKQIVKGLGQSNMSPEINQVYNHPATDLMDLPNEGAAYVARFSTLDGLIEHIISKVPEEYRYIPVTVHSFSLDKYLIPLKGEHFKNFEERDVQGFWILRASTSQNDQMFPNRSLLDGSASIIAFAFTLIAPVDEWSATILDIVLKYADRLYSKSLLQSILPTGTKDKLSMKDLAKSFSIYKLKFDYDLRVNNAILTLNNPERFDEVNPLLVEYLNRLGSIENNIGVILNLNFSFRMPLWKCDSYFYIFDPFENNPDGKHTTGGVACLMRFSSYDSMFKILQRKFNDTRKAITCQMIKVDMRSSFPKRGPLPDITLVNFHVPSTQSAYVNDEIEDAKILQIEPRKEHISEVLVNLAAIVLSHLLHSECWTAMILNKVFSLAQNLQDNSSEVKINVGADKIEMDLKGLTRCFTVDDAICTLNIDEIIRGPIIPKTPADLSLKNSFTLLMRNYCRGIVVTSSFICAIWREGDIYYLFNAPEKDVRPFVLSSKNEDTLYYWMYNNKPKDDLCNWYEIVRVEIVSVQKKQLDKAKKKKNTRKQFKKYHVDKGFVQNMKSFGEPCKGPLKPIGGKSHHINKSIDMYKRGKAACIVAAGMCYLKDISKWKKDIFDAVSRSALLLYMDSVAVQGRTAIDMVNMEKFFQLQQIQMHVEAFPPSEQEPTQQNVMQILTQTFNRHKVTYISTPSDSMLAIRWKKRYYAFHPEKMSSDGRYSKAHTENFPSLEKLTQHLIENIGDHSHKVFFGAINVHLLK